MPIIVSSSVGKFVYSSSGSVSYDKSNKVNWEVQSLSGSLAVSSSAGKTTLASSGSVSYGPNNTQVSGGTGGLISEPDEFTGKLEIGKNRTTVLVGEKTIADGSSVKVVGTLRIREN